VKLLVTGADGFVGRHLVRRLARDGHRIGAGCRPGSAPVDWQGADVTVLPLELTDDRSVRQAVDFGPDAVVHLAAVASNPEALADPGLAWAVNAGGTARPAPALGSRGRRPTPSHRRRRTPRARWGPSWPDWRSGDAADCR
jgi:nucleoside-diphosphate-sugar epimerase